MERSWQRYGRVNFTGWGTCVGGENLRITVTQNGGPSASLGKPASGSATMTLNLWYSDMGSANWCKPSAAQHQACLTSDSIHEFGHTLGFHHEEQRNDYGGPECGNASPNTTGRFYGAYTTASVMSYCSDGANGTRAFTELQPNDIAALQRAYGRRVDGQLVSINGDCASDNVGNGNPAFTWDCDEAAGQQWVSSSLSPWATLKIVQPGGSGCLDLPGGNVNNGTPVQIWSCLQNTNQTWAFENVQVRGWGGLCLTSVNGSSADGNPIRAAVCSGAGQLWSFASDGTVRLGSLSGPKCLTAGFNHRSDYFLWQCDGALDQRFNRLGNGTLVPAPTIRRCAPISTGRPMGSISAAWAPTRRMARSCSLTTVTAR